MQKKKKIRVTLDLVEPLYKRLEDLETLVEADSKAGVLRDALQLYEFVVRRTLDGERVQTINSEGLATDLVVLGVNDR